MTEDVASYGRQIGWLNDVVAALAKDAAAVKDDAKAESAYKALMDAREEDRSDQRAAQGQRLRRLRYDALAKLGAADKGEYGRLVRSLDPDRPPALT